jgi:tetrahydromethanopterin S-methyltransferase subunit C
MFMIKLLLGIICGFVGINLMKLQPEAPLLMQPLAGVLIIVKDK